MLDVMTIIGLVMGFGAVYLVMYWGGTAHLLWHRDAFVLVFGGTFASMLIATPMDVVFRLPKALMGVFVGRARMKPEEVITTLVSFSEIAKREGIPALQAELRTTKDRFLYDGVMAIIDGLDPSIVRENLIKEILFIRKRHHQVSSVIRSLGTYSPIFGLLATLLGVVQVLKGISDPKSLGASMAIAVTGTFYGISAANFFFLPMANKLDAHTESELLLKEVMIEGILSIQKGDIPIILNRKLQAFLAAKLRKKKG
jgi:chemotaxis protein MotA